MPGRSYSQISGPPPRRNPANDPGRDFSRRDYDRERISYDRAPPEYEERRDRIYETDRDRLYERERGYERDRVYEERARVERPARAFYQAAYEDPRARYGYEERPVRIPYEERATRFNQRTYDYADSQPRTREFNQRIGTPPRSPSVQENIKTIEPKVEPGMEELEQVINSIQQEHNMNPPIEFYVAPFTKLTETWD